MNKETFENYLMDIYIKDENPLDDMIPDGFNDWLDKQDVSDIMDYAQKWGDKVRKEIMEIIEKTKAELFNSSTFYEREDEYSRLSELGIKIKEL